MKNSTKAKTRRAIMLAVAGAIALTVVLGQTFAQTDLNSNNNSPPVNQTTPGTAPSPSASNTNNPVDLSKTTIDDILVSDTPNDKGYVLQNSKNQIPAKAEKIFATVQIGHAVTGMKVMASLIYDQDQSQIGPVEATVNTTADTTMVPFSFTTTSPPWLKGNYTIEFSIGNNITKTYHFTIN